MPDAEYQSGKSRTRDRNAKVMKLGVESSDLGRVSEANGYQSSRRRTRQARAMTIRAGTWSRRAEEEMTDTNTAARTMHDAGLAAWFGGSLMGAIGLNGAAAQVDDPGQRARVANAGWARWTPVNLGAIGAHLLGGGMLTWANRGRMATQQGVAGVSGAKTVVTLAALGATGYARVLGQKVMDAGDVPVEGGTSPSAATPPEVANAQKQLNMLQWVIAGLTGMLIWMTAHMGEQQRPKEVAAGMLSRFMGK